MTSNIEIEYRGVDGDTKHLSMNDPAPGRPLAETVRRVMDRIPDGGYAIAVKVDGEHRL